MAHYRIYPVEEGHAVGPARIIDADSDDEATEQARRLMGDCDCEIWHGSRFVVALARLERQGRAPLAPTFAGSSSRPSEPSIPTLRQGMEGTHASPASVRNQACCPSVEEGALVLARRTMS